MIPAARDPRMDRGRDAGDAGWQLVMVPRDARRPVERVALRSRELGAWKLFAGVLAVVVLAMALALGFTWPRSRAHGALVEENLELKRRLDAIDAKMGEVDRVLLRLRLYDAQLESLGAPRGDHGGPLPEDALANARLDARPSTVPPATLGPAWVGPGEPVVADTDDDGIRAPSEWAAEVEARAETFLLTFRRAEPDLARLLAEQESLGALRAALPSLLPANGFLSSGFGWRRNPFGGRWKHHAGVDLAGQKGDPILAAADGVVKSAGWSGGFGRAVELDHGFGITSIYAHCSQLLVTPGQRVRRGDRIGAMGTTGHSTGPHVHFEVRIDGHPVDPLDYVEDR